MNSGSNYTLRLPDHLVELTEKGRAQSMDGGAWLKRYCDERGLDLSNARIWVSPFIRTRQTAELFNRSLGVSSVKEDITITEQSYGLFDSVPEEELPTLFPREYVEYKRVARNQGKLYARPPMGESPLDVAIRINQFIETIRRERQEEGIDTVFVFLHGTALRTFLLRWFHYSPEWYQQEHNPKNCYIREIDGNEDKGYIYKGNEV